MSFGEATFAASATVVLLALVFRGRFFAIFSGVMLLVHGLAATSLARHAGAALPALVALHATVFLHLGSLVWARPRSAVFKALVQFPASFFWAGTFLATPWALAGSAKGAFVPYVVAALGLVDSLFPRRELVVVALDGADRGALRPLKRRVLRRTDEPEGLRVAQMTDTHIGPMMTVERLRRLAEQIAKDDPDLVLLTGDFLTMESNDDPRLLAEALSPLRRLSGRVFACRGNHDLEAPRTVGAALSEVGARLLVDELVRVGTRRGPVELLGVDFRFKDRVRALEEVFARFPRDLGVPRIALLHDPGLFRHVPDGAADLVLSGHTHGGQLGLLWLGLPQTILRALTRVPDHGLWAQGKNLLYVHRGTGHYGFPIRVGVPPEQGLLVLSGKGL